MAEPLHRHVDTEGDALEVTTTPTGRRLLLTVLDESNAVCGQVWIEATDAVALIAALADGVKALR